MEFVLQELCALASNISGSSRVRLVRVERKNKLIRYLAQSANQPRTIDLKYEVPGLGPKTPVMFARDVRQLPEIKNHPIFELLPNLSSFAIYRVKEDAEGSVNLSVVNPTPHFFENDRSLEAMERVVELIHLLLDSNGMASLRGGEESGFQEGAKSAGNAQHGNGMLSLSNGTEPASQFLYDTLVERPRLLGRNGCTYLSLRMWRKPIKPHQLAALVALKFAPPHASLIK
jgi:hypothetical protein